MTQPNEKTRDKIKLNNVHIGSSIEAILRLRGRNVNWLADQLCCDRTNIYNIFKRRSINTEQLEVFSKLLDFNFFALYNPESAHTEQYVLIVDKVNHLVMSRLETLTNLINDNSDIFKLNEMKRFKDAMRNLLSIEAGQTLVREMEKTKEEDATYESHIEEMMKEVKVVEKLMQECVESVEKQVELIDGVVSYKNTIDELLSAKDSKFLYSDEEEDEEDDEDE